MKNKAKSIFLALGLLGGGAVIGQALNGASINLITQTKPAELEENAKNIIADYTDSLESAKSAVQVQQVAAETGVRLQYIQIRQNAEVIRLLGQIAAKK